MSGVFQNIDPPPDHRLASASVSSPRLWCGGRTHSLGGEGSGWSIFWKTPDTALFSTCVNNKHWNHFEKEGYIWIILFHRMNLKLSFLVEEIMHCGHLGGKITFLKEHTGIIKEKRIYL